MIKRLGFRSATLLLTQLCFILAAPHAAAQNSKVMGEVKFQGATKVERDSGVWIDGDYVGYIKELKGDKKVLLLPGRHEIAVRQAGYADFAREIVVEPGQSQTIRVLLRLIPGAHPPDRRARRGSSLSAGKSRKAQDQDCSAGLPDF